MLWRQALSRFGPVFVPVPAEMEQGRLIAKDNPSDFQFNLPVGGEQVFDEC